MKQQVNMQIEYIEQVLLLECWRNNYIDELEDVGENGLICKDGMFKKVIVGIAEEITDITIKRINFGFCFLHL